MSLRKFILVAVKANESSVKVTYAHLDILDSEEATL